MASASAGVNPACPVAIRYTAGAKMRSSATSGSTLGSSATAGDAAVPDLRHGCSAEGHLVCSYPLAFGRVELRFADELGVDRAKWAGVEPHHAAQR